MMPRHRKSRSASYIEELEKKRYERLGKVRVFEEEVIMPTGDTAEGLKHVNYKVNKTLPKNRMRAVVLAEDLEKEETHRRKIRNNKNYRSEFKRIKGITAKYKNKRRNKNGLL